MKTILKLAEHDIKEALRFWALYGNAGNVTNVLGVKVEAHICKADRPWEIDATEVFAEVEVET